MKTWEMIKELTENPDKKYISYAKKGDRDILRTRSVRGAIRFSNEEDNWHDVLIGIDLNREWEEVKKPVDFMAAVKSGKRIRVEHPLVDDSDNNDLIDYTSIDGFLFSLGGGFFTEDVRDIIQNGKFYIKD